MPGKSSAIRLSPFACLVLVAILLCSCSENITIKFMEDERWEAEAYYSRSCDSDNSSYCDDLDRAVRVAESLGIRASRSTNKIEFEGQGFEALEHMFKYSRCCHSAEVEVRLVEGERRVFFNLKEEADPISDWTVTLYGGEIVESSARIHREDRWEWVKWEEDTWLRGEVDHSKDSHANMSAVLTEKATSKLNLLVGGVFLVSMIALFAILFGTGQRMLIWWMLANTLPLTSFGLIIWLDIVPNNENTVLVMTGLFLFLLALLQWLVLDMMLQISNWWIPATVAGWVVFAVLWFIGAMIVAWFETPISQALVWLPFTVIGAASLGTLQALVLRSKLRKQAWWILSNIVATSSLLLVFVFLGPFFVDNGSDLLITIYLTLFGIVYGLITGLTLVMLAVRDQAFRQLAQTTVKAESP